MAHTASVAVVASGAAAWQGRRTRCRTDEPQTRLWQVHGLDCLLCARPWRRGVAVVRMPDILSSPTSHLVCILCSLGVTRD